MAALYASGKNGSQLQKVAESMEESTIAELCELVTELIADVDKLMKT